MRTPRGERRGRRGALGLVRAAGIRPPRDRRAGANPRARHVVVYTWNLQPELIHSARDLGVDGYLSKALAAAELVAPIEAVHAGEVVISDPGRRATSVPGLDWPGRLEGITDRESEILALITQGMSNADVARPTYLSPQHGQVLQPLHLPQDRCHQPHPSRALRRQPRLRPRPPTASTTDWVGRRGAPQGRRSYCKHRMSHKGLTP